MATAIKLDTLKFAKRLTDAGMDQKIAEALVEGLSEADTSELATKQDIARLEASTKQDIARLEASTKQDIARLEASIVRLEAKVDTGLAELRSEIFRAMLIQAGTIVGLTVALIKVLP
jgi:hypothetical protein